MSKSHKVHKKAGDRRKHFKYIMTSSFLLSSAFCFFLVVVFFIYAGIKSKEKAYTKKTKDGSYQLIVENKPYFIKGVCYNPAPVGAGYDYDLGKDKYKPWVVDGKLMQDMGINTIRLYKESENPQGLKEAISYLYEKHGIRTALGHWLGFWEYPQPSYASTDFREKIKKQTLDMVRMYKDEKGILLWVLGNENNYSFSGRINPWACPEAEGLSPAEAVNTKAKIYYTFVNELVREIHKVDPKHPVALANGELLCLDAAARYCPDVDIVAILMYRGRSFGNVFNNLKNTFDKPLLFVEFGADSYNSFKQQEDEGMQAFFLENQWNEIYKNSAFSKEGTGNTIGGMIFEWSDEWWKHNPDYVSEWKTHDASAGWSNGSYYMDIKAEKNLNMNEEWFGIVGISEDIEAGLNKRLPRKAYYTLKDFFTRIAEDKGAD